MAGHGGQAYLTLAVDKDHESAKYVRAITHRGEAICHKSRVS
jgi:hypothetical protein